MLPGMNFNPKKMQGMLKQMGISQEDIEAERVVIEQTNKRIIIENPSVQRIKMQGKESFQISGDVKEEEKSEFSEEDINLIMEKTGSNNEEILKVLEETRDIAETIAKLSKNS